MTALSFTSGNSVTLTDLLWNVSAMALVAMQPLDAVGCSLPLLTKTWALDFGERSIESRSARLPMLWDGSRQSA